MLGCFVKGAVESGLNLQQAIDLALNWYARMASEDQKRRLLDGDFPAPPEKP